jgi:uncharacterized protein
MDNTQVLYLRLLETRITEAMADTPVVLVAGPRQAGKTTLVRQIAAQGMRYLTLDDELTLLAAKEDPMGLIRSLDRAVIDEIQRAPWRRLLGGSAVIFVGPVILVAIRLADISA